MNWIEEESLLDRFSYDCDELKDLFPDYYDYEKTREDFVPDYFRADPSHVTKDGIADLARNLGVTSEYIEKRYADLLRNEKAKRAASRIGRTHQKAS